MIVFWRLFLSLYMADFLLFHKMAKIQAKNHTLATAIRSGVFLVCALWLCRHYLTLSWPFFGVIDLPGWLCVVLFGVFFACVHQFFDFGGRMRYGHLLTFFVKNAFLLLFLFLCTPFLVVYQTGNFFAQPWVIFLVGLVVTTRLVEWFLVALEQDCYGAHELSFDEQWMMMMMRLIFFLIMLLPGVRWLILFVIWLAAAIYARKIRLLDVANTVFYISVASSFIIGLLVRLRMYWVG